MAIPNVLRLGIVNNRLYIGFRRIAALNVFPKNNRAKTNRLIAIYFRGELYFSYKNLFKR